MSQDPNYQDQGSLDQPQQPVEPGAYQTPGVTAPEDQEATPEQPLAEQVAGGGAAQNGITTVPTPGEGEVQLPDGSIVPDTQATPQVIQDAQNSPAPVQPAPGGGDAGDGVGQGGEAVSE